MIEIRIGDVLDSRLIISSNGRLEPYLMAVCYKRRAEFVNDSGELDAGKTCWDGASVQLSRCVLYPQVRGGRHLWSSKLAVFVVGKDVMLLTYRPARHLHP